MKRIMLFAIFIFTFVSLFIFTITTPLPIKDFTGVYEGESEFCKVNVYVRGNNDDIKCTFTIEDEDVLTMIEERKYQLRLITDKKIIIPLLVPDYFEIQGMTVVEDIKEKEIVFKGISREKIREVPTAFDLQFGDYKAVIKLKKTDVN